MSGREHMEMAIEQNDMRLAKYRMAQKDGLKQQENWADTYHGERMVGKSVVFGFMVLATIWFSDLPAYLFYGVAALLVIVVLALVWTARKQGNRLEQIREQQMRDHAAQKAARKASAGE